LISGAVSPVLGMLRFYDNCMKRQANITNMP
jgi:hypothetical protein